MNKHKLHVWLCSKLSLHMAIILISIRTRHLSTRAVAYNYTHNSNTMSLSSVKKKNVTRRSDCFFFLDAFSLSPSPMCSDVNSRRLDMLLLSHVYTLQTTADDTLSSAADRKGVLRGRNLSPCQLAVSWPFFTLQWTARDVTLNI